MPKLAFATDRQLRSAKPRQRDYRVGCGSQLFLRITPAGHKYWQVRYYQTNGKESLHQFAGYPATSLLQAKQEAAKLLPTLLAGQATPAVAARQAQRAAQSFDQCAKQYIEAKRPEWKNIKHAQQWVNTLSQYASPVFGASPIESVSRDDILRCLEPIWLTRNETASRLRGRIESVLDWAKAKGLREGDNPAQWKGGLQNLLATPSKTQKSVHHPSLPYAQIPALVQNLKAQDGESAKALIFLILTAARTNEALGATWDEIQDTLWTIPAERMKAGKEHRVPLSTAVLKLLRTQSKANTYIFSHPAASHKALSNMSMAMLLRRMGLGHITVHGFRASFRNWAAEQTTYPREVCEHALAHQLPDKVEAAYLRSDLLDKRRALMQDWARYCGSGKS